MTEGHGVRNHIDRSREREGERKIERMGKRIELKKMVYLGREW